MFVKAREVQQKGNKIMTATVDTMSIKYFDTLEYVQKAKEIKDPGDLATYQVKQIESAIETAVKHVQHEIYNNEFATKTDVLIVKNELTNVKNELKQDIKNLDSKIELKIAELRFDMLKFIVWTGLGSLITLAGMMAHGFHWI